MRLFKIILCTILGWCAAVGVLVLCFFAYLHLSGFYDEPEPTGPRVVLHQDGRVTVDGEEHVDNPDGEFLVTDSGYGYLYYGQTKLFEQRLSVVIDKNHSGEPGYQVYFVKEEENAFHVFLRGVAGCGGCSWLDQYKVVVEKEPLAARIEPLVEHLDDFYFTRRHVRDHDVMFSPEKDKVAYVKDVFSPDGSFEPFAGPKEVWVFDIANATEEYMGTAVESASLFDCEHGMFCVLSEFSFRDGELISPVPLEYAPRFEVLDDGYLFRLDTQITEERVVDILYDDPDLSRSLSCDLFSTVERGDSFALYFACFGEREGSWSLAERYLVISKDDFSYHYDVRPMNELSYFGTQMYTKRGISPDGQKVAYVRLHADVYVEHDGAREDVWIFDLTTGTDTYVGTVPNGKTFLLWGRWYLTKYDAFRWDGDTLNTRVPLEMRSLYRDDLGIDEISVGWNQFFENKLQKRARNGQYYVYPFDFEKDGELEFFVYFRETKPKDQWAVKGYPIEWKGVQTVFKKDHNGLYQLVYEGEGIVGKDDHVYLSEELNAGGISTEDVDDDGQAEVRVSRYVDGSGNYVFTHYLYWDNDLGMFVRVESEPSDEELKDIKETFLTDGEYFGPSWSFVLPVCPDVEPSNCGTRQSAPGSIGKIEYKVRYKNGTLEPYDIKRIDY